MFDTIEDFLADIEAYRERHGMTVSAFGKEAVNDAHLIPEIRAGRDMKMSTIRRVKAFMERD